MATKRHHYLPLHYLGNFLLPGQQAFVVYDKTGLPPREQTPINTGVEGRLYTVLDPEGQKNDSIETDILKPLDDAAAPVIARWISGAQHEVDDVPTLAAFMASLSVRAPRQIAFSQDVAVAAIVKVNRDLASDPAAFAEMIRKYNEVNPDAAIVDVEPLRQEMLILDQEYHISVDRQFGMLHSIGLLGDIAKALLDMRWLVLRATAGQEFVVGDSPVSVFVPHPDERASIGAGFLHPLAEVAFPLDPERCLYLRRSSSPRLPTTRELNRRMIWQAERFVVSSRHSDDIEALVKEFAFTIDLPLLDRDELLRGIGNDMDPAP